MNIIEENKNEITILHIEGRLDASTSNDLNTKALGIIEAGKTKLIFDFKAMDYLSSAGMRVLLGVSKKIKSVNGKFIVCSLTKEVLEIIKIAGFQQILHITDNEEKALQEI